MTDYSEIDFSPLDALADGEVVTHSVVRDIRLASGKVMALVTLDNGRDHTRPNTLGPLSLLEYARTLDELAARAAAGEIQAVAITGKPFILAAGADLSKVAEVPDKDTARKFAELGHFALGKAYEDQADYKASFEHYSAGNALRLREIHPEDASITKTVEIMMSFDVVTM